MAVPSILKKSAKAVDDKASRVKLRNSLGEKARLDSIVRSSKPKPSITPRPARSFLSALKDDETDFPRGGGSSLTPFEQRQVQAEGRREADEDAEVEVRF